MQLSDVTIIIPVYCATKESLLWLDECVVSALSQNVAVVVYDDGSPLSINDTLATYGCKVVYDKHVGVSHARNEAIKTANTKLIFPLDCDDRLVPNAIVTLLDMYNGTPLYCDVSKFGDVTVPHYALLDFSCVNVRKFVGFSSVNILHSKEQWQSVGGYDEKVDFYEDGEYNARLFLKYCGMRCPRPLVEYRIHKGQRTDLYKDQSSKYARELIAKIGEYEMACAGCGKRKTQSSFMSNAVTNMVQNSANINELSLTQGTDVLVQYVGGNGRGKHYYEGLVSKRRYKVSYGIHLYVDQKDARLASQIGNPSYFVKVVREEVKKAMLKQLEVKQPEVVTTVSPSVQETVATAIVNTTELPDISNMTLKNILQSDDITADNAAALLVIEEHGHKRDIIVKHLKSFLK